MTLNMSTLDRRIRAFAVVPLLAVAALLVGAGTVLGIALLAVAVVMLATSAVGFCPLYRIFHLDTRGGGKPLPH